MTQELVVAGCKSPDRKKAEESHFAAAGSSRILGEAHEDPIVPNNMEPLPSSSTWSEEESLPQDLFLSWKKETLGTICSKLSERQRSAFIFVSIFFY
jgi:hypothetical protein